MLKKYFMIVDPFSLIYPFFQLAWFSLLRLKEGRESFEEKMGRLFVVTLEGKIYSCKYCGVHLAVSDDILSKVLPSSRLINKQINLFYSWYFELMYNLELGSINFVDSVISVLGGWLTLYILEVYDFFYFLFFLNWTSQLTIVDLVKLGYDLVTLDCIICFRLYLREIIFVTPWMVLGFTGME